MSFWEYALKTYVKFRPRSDLKVSNIKFEFKMPTYPSPKPTLIFTSYLEQNVGFGEG